MSAGETVKHRWRQVRGLIQDYIGRLTGSTSKRAKGHGKMVGGEVQHRAAGARDQTKDAASDAKDGVADTAGSARDKITGQQKD